MPADTTTPPDTAPPAPLAPTAASIAMDLATAIEQGHIGPGRQLPTQSELMKAYGVAMATASSALHKVRDAGLATSRPGAGVFAAARPQHTDIALLYRAGRVCRSLAATSWPPDRTPTIEVVDAYDHDSQETVGRALDATVLAALDRTVLRALGDTFTAAARRIVGHGPGPDDPRLIEAARAVLRDGARRPDNQPSIPVYSGPHRDEDAVTRRLWPHLFTDTDTAWPF